MPKPDASGPVQYARKPRAELRHWSDYATVGDWFADYRGYVPIQMAHGLSQVIRRTGMSFPDAYRSLLGRGAIVHIDPRDDAEPVGPDALPGETPDDRRPTA